MFSKERTELDRLRDELAESQKRYDELAASARTAARTAHGMVEQTRYTLEAAAKHASNPEALERIAHALPYVFSGRRHWSDPAMPEIAAERVEDARRVAAAYGFQLPDDPATAVESLLAVAAMLLDPAHNLKVKGMRSVWPLRDATGYRVE